MTTELPLNLDLAERFERWMLVRKYALSTRTQYAHIVRDYAEFLGPKPFTKSTHFDVQEFAARRAQLAPAVRSIRGVVYSLRIFFDFLCLGGLITWVPPRLVRLRKDPPRIPSVLTKHQISSLFTATRNRFERAVLETLYGTGCRPGELCSMRVEDIDFGRRRIRVRGKRGIRFVLFTARVMRSLRRYLCGRTTGYVFSENAPTQKIIPRRTESGAWRCTWRVFDKDGKAVRRIGGFVPSSEGMDYLDAVIHFAKLARRDCFRRPVGIRPVGVGLIDRTVRQVGLRAGIRAYPYRLRHSFATHLLDNGADIRVIQELMGHAKIDCTQTYTQVSKQLAARTFRKFHPRT